MNESKSNQPTPGDVVRERLAQKGWTQDDLAHVIHRSRQQVNAVIVGRSSLSPEMAAAFAAALGDSPEWWMSLEGNRQLGLLSESAESVSRRARLLDLAPIKEIEKRGWINSTKTTQELERELMAFFGVESLDVEPPVVASMRKADPDSAITREQRAWVARARQLAAAHPAPPFNEARGKELLAKLRRLAAFPRESAQVADVLFDFGIRFVVIQPLEKSRIDGAAFWINDTPAIALSLRYGRIDAFWFTLMHEVAHILHKDEGSIDSDLAGKGQVPSRMKAIVERRADEAAAEALINPQQLEEFVTMFSPLYSQARIAQFANRIKIHPGIIVGQLQHRAELGWQSGRSVLVDVREHVTSTALTDGWGKTISPDTL